MSDLEYLAGLLRRTAKAHHRAFIATDGFDPDWASWYAKFLLENGFGRLVKVATPSEVDLARLLIETDRRHQAEAVPPPWQRYYAKALLEAIRPGG